MNALTVDRQEFRKTLNSLGRIVPKRLVGHAALSFEDGIFQIELPGGGTGLPAQGEWHGIVRISGDVLLNLARALPDTDRVSISAQEGKLTIGTLSISCVMDDDGPPSIQVPLNASLSEVVHIQLTHDNEEIRRSGLTPVIEKAMENVYRLIGQAAVTLAPLEVAEDDIRQLVVASIKKRYKL